MTPWLLLALITGSAAQALDPEPRGPGFKPVSEEPTGKMPVPRQSHSTVGMPTKIGQLVLPGTELEVKPIEDRRQPVIVRIVDCYPHGSAFRYDVVYYTLEPGRYNLKDYLRRKDGSPAADLPPIPVLVEAVLPPGQVEPHALALGESPWLGGYRLLVVAAVLAWCAGLAVILFAGRRRRAALVGQADRPATLADRLRPLVDAALAGTLSAERHAELERLLIGYWRSRLGLEQLAPARMMAVLRDHDEAGPLVRQLEDWLHRPPSTAGPVDVAALLKPYQGIAAGDLENRAEHGAPAAPSAQPGTSSRPRREAHA
jgi:hypothetical protein